MDKKPYPLRDGISSTSKRNIDEALKPPEQESLDSTTTYEAQVEVGYQKQILTVSHDEKVPNTGCEAKDLPFAADSRKFLTNQAPQGFKNWSAEDWGVNQLTDSVVYGPVFSKQFKGTWKGLKLFVELWPIRRNQTDASLEPIVEASFNTFDLKKALEGRTNLVKLLQKDGWFLAEDFLKTKLIMEQYGEATAHL